LIIGATEVAFLALIQIAEAATGGRLGARRDINRGGSRLSNGAWPAALTLWPREPAKKSLPKS
jgi:hypothetical protein